MLKIALLATSAVCITGCQLNQPTSHISPAQTIETNGFATADFSAHWLTQISYCSPIPANNIRYFLQAGSTDQAIKLQPITLPPWVNEQYPHLTGFSAFSVPLDANTIKQWLKKPLFVYSPNDGVYSHQANVQTSVLLDHLYTRSANDADEETELGATIKRDGVHFKLWAPTATKVSVNIFNHDKVLHSTFQLKENNRTGIWHVNTPNEVVNPYYQYQIDVYHPSTGQFEQVTTTDPYSLSLSTNSRFSQVVDLSDPNTQPLGWHNQQDIELAKPEDAILYEAHIHDFSAIEQQLSDQAYRGKYKAFSEQNSDGIKHLIRLQQAGLNHIHLLPAFDIGTINEQQSITLTSELSDVCELVPTLELCSQPYTPNQTLQALLTSYDPHTLQAANLISQIRAKDDYNWGYDPFHYTVPEGSYAVNPDGITRIVEFREMVQSLHNKGLRVVMDVVYNHTHQARMEKTAVLDKIVPNYYQRLDPISGMIAQSTCCDNTATERVMMEKLMTDSLVVWAKDYKIDGFRFDLMGHQPKSAMLRAREAVRAVDNDTYFYGEGWNFGEVANNAQFVQATQLEMAGTQIGTFSDRLRDAVRGNGFNLQGDQIRQNQGIGNGLGVRPNELSRANTKDYFTKMNQLRIGLVANLANFAITDQLGDKILGKDIPYGDQPTGYALDPADTINYVSKHDNQTLWDNNQYRNAYDLSTAERIRLHNQSLSYPLLAQGIPFLHMGSEFLRSKSFLRDSYDYGDWFNRVDFSKQNNFYDVGLPAKEKDHANHQLIKQVIKNNRGKDKVTADDIQFASQQFVDFMTIRRSSPLFRLSSEQEILNQVSFLNTGKGQQTGLIAMKIVNQAQDKRLSQIIVLFNSSPLTKKLAYHGAQAFALHPAQRNGVDKIVKQSTAKDNYFSVPAFTTSVFIQKLQ